jgi:predicted RNA binding protein YcfA (HicA-like mRNA interferase family)
MAEEVPFSEVLMLFESQGWKLQRISGSYRVFMTKGELPWLIPVHDQKVSVEYVDKIKAFFREREEDQ